MRKIRKSVTMLLLSRYLLFLPTIGIGQWTNIKKVDSATGQTVNLVVSSESRKRKIVIYCSSNEIDTIFVFFHHAIDSSLIRVAYTIDQIPRIEHTYMAVNEFIEKAVIMYFGKEFFRRGSLKKMRQYNYPGNVNTLINNMKRGNIMEIRGFSSRGIGETFLVPLIGFTKAFNASECQ